MPAEGGGERGGRAIPDPEAARRETQPYGRGDRGRGVHERPCGSPPGSRGWKAVRGCIFRIRGCQSLEEGKTEWAPARTGLILGGTGRPAGTCGDLWGRVGTGGSAVSAVGEVARGPLKASAPDRCRHTHRRLPRPSGPRPRRRVFRVSQGGHGEPERTHEWSNPLLSVLLTSGLPDVLWRRTLFGAEVWSSVPTATGHLRAASLPDGDRRPERRWEGPSGLRLPWDRSAPCRVVAGQAMASPRLPLLGPWSCETEAFRPEHSASDPGGLRDPGLWPLKSHRAAPSPSGVGRVTRRREVVAAGAPRADAAGETGSLSAGARWCFCEAHFPPGDPDPCSRPPARPSGHTDPQQHTDPRQHAGRSPDPDVCSHFQKD